MLSITFLIFILNVSLSLTVSTLDCPLVWRQLALGDPIPSDAFLVSSSLQSTGYVARTTIDGTISGGRYSKGLALIISPSKTALNLTTDYEILSNPHGCTLKWLPGLPTKHVMLFGPNSQPIARGVIDNAILAGPLTNGRLKAVDDNLAVRDAPIFETLTSFSPGLRLELSDFVYLNENVPTSEEYLGLDIIHNQGASELKQTVSLKQRLFDSLTTSVGSMSESTHSVSLSAQASLLSGTLGVGGALDFGWTNGQSKSEANHYEKETWLDVTRQVTVPPYTSIVVCSMVQMAKDFKVDYIAKGRYSAPGISAATVQNIMEAEGKPGPFKIEGDIVITQERGSMAGNLGLSTKFIVVPFDSFGGCSEVLARKAILAHQTLA